MHRTLLLLICGFCALIVSAVPAKRERHTLTLADGSTLVATAMGDEILHFFRTDDGRFLQCDSLGIAHFVDSEALQTSWQAKAERRQSIRNKRNNARRARQQSRQNIMTGSKTGLVILVEFPDVPFNYSSSTFKQFFNEVGYSDEINIGSVHDYFYSASYGHFNFTFDVVGPVTVSHNLSYYGANNSRGDDMYPATMVSEAVEIVDRKIDFSKYDWDGDGKVEQIFVIHSGHDEAQSSVRNDIWSHAWTLTEALEEENDGNGAITVDGVTVDCYATSSELRNKRGTSIAGIGTACHEFSHCFGLPDFYDTSGSSFCMNSWDLLDYGSYNGDGGIPAGFTSYERMFCGWLDPVELTEPIEIKDMPSLISEPVAYILKNSGCSDEYYLLENRQKESWDAELGGHGMLILHIDYDSQAWEKNTVNTIRNHHRLSIIPADNLLSSFTLSGDPWPGTSRNTELSDSSTPAATLFNENANGEKLMNHSITEIKETREGYISFIFDEEALGIDEIKNEKLKGNNNIYDLSGRKCSMPAKGIYIQEGRKLYIR
ncbi:MAG: M6 family metalloprotease domain-containing protein [Bacteroidaceae bacterium]|nr:M6 family metalloprotease domain-containing protein [Bacteroidaceae bacterium]